MATAELRNISPEGKAVCDVAVGSLAAADAASAVTASFCVSPLITIVDRAIIQNASGAAGLGTSVRRGLTEFCLRPHVFLRRPEFAMVWGVYASTYMTVNLVITACERAQMDNRWAKFSATTLVNMAVCISKDRAFARMFGTSVPRPLPIPSYLMFTLRDGSTVGASFNLPAPVSLYLQDNFRMTKGHADVTSQMICPAAAQFLSTPLHLMGLDFYNNPNSKMASRLDAIRSMYTPTVTARICRIGPAFGIGGIGNTRLRAYFRSLVGC